MIGGVLLDISGILYQGDVAIPGAVEAVRRLRNAGLPIRFLTNLSVVRVFRRERGGFVTRVPVRFLFDVMRRHYRAASGVAGLSVS